MNGCDCCVSLLLKYTFKHFFVQNEYIEDIQMFLLNMAFISSSEVEYIYILWVAKPRMKYTYLSLHE